MMSEGLSPDQLAEATAVGVERKQLGDTAEEARRIEQAKQGKADKMGKMLRLFRPKEASMADVAADRAAQLTRAAEAGNRVAEANATRLYTENEGSYQEQAVIEAGPAIEDAKARGVQIDGQPIQSLDFRPPTPDETVAMAQAEATKQTPAQPQ